ncbi:Phenylalanine--tRNA ligase beta subunit [uncultured archaeon]|nr:Phenylalanine--tRNA ligase beta subunit [uncultured archaeon]
MALITVSFADLKGFASLSRAVAEDGLTRLGIPVEKFEGDVLDLEITPNRPDWLSVEGVGRSLLAFSKRKAKHYRATKSDYGASVEDSVRRVRPYFA